MNRYGSRDVGAFSETGKEKDRTTNPRPLLATVISFLRGDLGV